VGNILLGLQQLLDPVVLLALLGGTLLGLTVGAIPGLNDTITMAVLIPITFGMDKYVAMAVLIGIYVASACGGSIPAILFDIPGTASAMVTSNDGYPMRLKGRGKEALSIAMMSSCFGGLSSSVVLLICGPLLAGFALKFGSPEYCMVAVLGFATVIGMSSKNIALSFLSIGFGLWISCIGISPTIGLPRYTFGSATLMDGVSLIPSMIGLFGLCSVLKEFDKIGYQKTQEELMAEKEVAKTSANDKIGFLSGKMCRRLLPTWLRSSAIGNILGIVPGCGMVMAVFMAYDTAKRSNPELPFGTGVEEGVAAPESANNSVVASSMVPLLSLGVPGNGTSSLFLGALMIQGLRTGPGLFTDYPDVAYMIILGFLVANIAMIPMSLTFCKYCASAVLKINPQILNAAIVVLCVTGAFASSNNAFHIGMMIVFGVIGYIYHKFGMSQSPLMLSYVLGSMMETNYINALVVGKGSFSVFITRPISLVLVCLSAVFLFMPVYQKLRQKRAASA